MTTPAKAQLPQYAYYVNKNTGRRSEVIIVQAQHIDNQYVVGAIDVNEHNFVVGIASDFELFINRWNKQPDEVQLAPTVN